MRLAGLVLAGGRGSRMGGATLKPLLDLGGRPLIAHVLARMPDEADPVLISANDPATFAAFGLPVVVDRIAGSAGPLAGLDAAAAFIESSCPEVLHLLCLPGDTPFLPPDISARLMTTAGMRPAVARHRGRLQPAAALWTMDALRRLPDFLVGGEKASIRAFLDRVGYDAVDLPDDGAAEAPDGDPFFNVNTPDDLARARAFLAGR